MKNRNLLLILGILFLFLLVSCKPTPTPKVPRIVTPVFSTSTSIVEGETVITEVIPSPTPNEVDQTRDTLKEFLSALKKDINSSDVKNYLGADIKKQISEGEKISNIIGVESISSFEVSAGQFSSDGATISFDCTVTSDQSTNLVFIFQKEDSEWKIEKISHSKSNSAYPVNPEDVVQAFLLAYQEAPDTMSVYLSEARHIQPPPGGGAGMLQITGVLEGSMVQSATVSQDPAYAIIKIAIRAEKEEHIRIFYLVKEKESWYIDNIEKEKT
jgi:hypothetical protein